MTNYSPNTLLTGRRRYVAYVTYTLVSAALGLATIVAANPLIPADWKTTADAVVDTGSKALLYIGATFGLVAANNVDTTQDLGLVLDDYTDQGELVDPEQPQGE